MLSFLKKEANRTLTENGALTLRSSGAYTLDLFATIGALRNAEDDEVIRRFQRAWAEDRGLAMRILFYARDIRGGLGERRVFRTILRALAHQEPESVRKNLPLIPEFGRWDDVDVLFDTPVEKDMIALIRSQLAQDMASAAKEEPVSLMAKWLPSVNASNPDTVRLAKRLVRALDMNDAAYRKALVMLRQKIRILENYLREMDYTFEYSQQPSKAMFKYRKAFLRNDAARYQSYLEAVKAGKTVLHTGTLMPYELVREAMKNDLPESQRRTLDVTWNALEDFTGDENALAVIDGSGSMYWSAASILPAEVALSLGMYFAERNTGAFRNHFITFSQNPRLVEIKGRDFVEKVRYCETFNECANTDIQKVFELILYTAAEHRVPQKEMPSRLYFISDMEFDACARGAQMTNFEYAKQLFARHGYRLPQVVFWNVASRNEQQPVSRNEQGVALVSGASARLFSMAMNGEMDPMAYMLSVLNGSRYAAICA